MALDRTAVMKLSTAYFFFAPDKELDCPDAAVLFDIDAMITAGFQHIGYTSSENALETNTSGGDVSYDGPLQNLSLFTSITPQTTTFTTKVWEWSAQNLKLAAGKNFTTLPNGMIGKNINPVPNTGTLVVVFKTVEGGTAFYAPLCEVLGSTDFGAIGGQNSYGDLPLDFTPKLADGHQAPFYVAPVAAIPAA